MFHGRFARHAAAFTSLEGANSGAVPLLGANGLLSLSLEDREVMFSAAVQKGNSL